MIDFAMDCYAYVSAKDAYPDNSVVQAWAINRYRVAWREHFWRRTLILEEKSSWRAELYMSDCYARPLCSI